MMLNCQKWFILSGQITVVSFGDWLITKFLNSRLDFLSYLLEEKILSVNTFQSVTSSNPKAVSLFIICFMGSPSELKQENISFFQAC